MKLNEIRDNEGARKARTRVGRGLGSGKGSTCGRGQKGQKSRSGVSINGFEGGQMPIYRRLPKRGFNNIFAKDIEGINVGTIQAAIDAGKLDASKTVDVNTLKSAGLIRKQKDGIRLLGMGELKAKVEFKAHGASKTALEAIEKAGGKVEIMAKAKPTTGKKAERRANSRSAK
jgi:large subunit ribosomal protein L15